MRSSSALVRTFVLATFVALAPLSAHASEHRELLPDTYHVEQLAPGVFAVVRDLKSGPSDSNVLFIINDADVIVVDANIFPASAAQVIQEIRKRTNKPVRYVINTHWHSDHHYGNQKYRDAYPGVEFVSHSVTRDSIIKEDIPDLKQNLEKVYPAELRRLQGILASGKWNDTTPLTQELRKRINEDVDLYQFFLKDAAGTPKTAVVDSANKQLLRGSKAAKSGKGSSAGGATLTTKSSGLATAKPARTVANPSITPTSTSPIKASVVAPDSASKSAPAVRRSSKTAKAKPPAI